MGFKFVRKCINVIETKGKITSRRLASVWTWSLWTHPGQVFESSNDVIYWLGPILGMKTVYKPCKPGTVCKISANSKPVVLAHTCINRGFLV